MRWELTYRADQHARKIADRHYNRQSIGSVQFVPPGRCMVLHARSDSGEALWVTSFPFAEWTKHDWAGAWVNSLFRNEGAGLSSELILEAVAATRWFHRNTKTWQGPEPELGMVTFVDPASVESKNPGYCYQCAGFEKVGKTKMKEFLAYQMLPSDMPDPHAPLGASLNMFSTTTAT